MTTPDDNDLKETKRIMGALVRQPPKPHAEMKVGKARSFLAVAWNNGSHHRSGAGYGLKISAADRDAHLRREWGTVDLYFPGRDKPAAVNVDKESLWGGTCRELISREIGEWLISNHMAP